VSPAGAGPAAQAAKEVHTLWLTAELGLSQVHCDDVRAPCFPRESFLAAAVALVLAALLIADLLPFDGRDSTPNLRRTADLTA
jgi:hypothetical protein